MPEFALDLDHTGIRLLRRRDGAWASVVTIALDDPDLPTRLRDLRDMAAAEVKGDLETTLIIPASQILYTSVPAPRGRTRIRDEDVAGLLEGLTSCPVEELVFDWRREGDTIRVAALETNTLDEAESFAVPYGFNPVGFSALPTPEQFPEEPNFGGTQFANRDEIIPTFASSRATASADTVAPAKSISAPRSAATVAKTPPPKEPARLPPVLVGSVATLAVITALVWTALAILRPDAPAEFPEIAEIPAVPSLEQQIPVVQARQGEDQDLTPNLAREPIAGLPTPTEMAARGDAANAVPGATGRESEVLAEGETATILSGDIWQKPSPQPPDPVGESLQDLYLAAVDPALTKADAFALFAPNVETQSAFRPFPGPDPSITYDLDERGLVIATPDGAITPDGIIVTLGRPTSSPPPRPATAVSEIDTELALLLAGKSPRFRPADLIERIERANLGGRTRAELAQLRPLPRPESAQQTAAVETDSNSPLAVQVSRAAPSRPANFAAVVAASQARRTTTGSGAIRQVAAAGAVATPQPSIPSSASVARQATISNAINLRRLNLIGVYGSDNSRRALVRLSSGRYVKVEVGDKIDGGRITAIGNASLQYRKGSRNITLEVPSG